MLQLSRDNSSTNSSMMDMNMTVGSHFGATAEVEVEGSSTEGIFAVKDINDQSD
jgi:hypothetical protein